MMYIHPVVLKIIIKFIVPLEDEWFQHTAKYTIYIGLEKFKYHFLFIYGFETLIYTLNIYV